MLARADRYALLDEVAADAYALGMARWGGKPKTWRETARHDQLLPEGTWSTWVIQAGRGWGKTRTGAEAIKELIERGHRRVGIVGPTAGDVRDVMIEGESGLLSVFPDNERPLYEPSKSRVTFANGAIANLRSADEPDRVRGLQFTALWCDELASWRYPQCYDILQFGNRLKVPDPVTIVTTTPKTGVKKLKEIKAEPGTVLTRGKMRDNIDNLSEKKIKELEAKYQGTRLGRQELEGEDIEDVEGALWQLSMFETPGFRLEPAFQLIDGKLLFTPPSDMVKVVVAIDPSVTDPELRKDPHKDPAACGMVVAGVSLSGRGYVLADYSAVSSPATWAKRAVNLYSLTKASGVVAEGNQGGALITEVLRNVASNVPVEIVYASVGKRARAEPVSLLYEQGRISHCGPLPDLEEEMTTWNASDPGAPSPNRVDALVWAMHGLGLCNVTGTRMSEGMRSNRGKYD